jgi:hypothetical protein
VAFLRNFHRHRFGVFLSLQVTDLDRELEFFTEQENLSRACAQYHHGYFDHSCEELARRIATRYYELTGRVPYSVTVDEDGENSATLTFPNK